MGTIADEKELTMFQKSLLGALLTAAAVSVPAPAFAQVAGWPAKPVQIVVPFVPGGYIDAYARLVATRLGPVLGQPVYVENRPGNSGNTGSEHVAKAAPDGYTLLVTAINTHAVNVSLYKDLPFDPVRDFTPIAQIADGYSAWIVPTSLNVATVGELNALARSQPDALSYGSAGVGTLGHLMFEWMKSRSGVRINHVPYKGENDALLAALRGDVAASQASVASVLPHVKAGKVRVIATTGSTRAAPLPDVPTISETVPGVSGSAWIGLFGPANLPPAITQRINREIELIMTSPDVQERLAASALVYRPMSPEQFGVFQRAEIAKWAEVIKTNGIRID
jgi:tripartite-type tricarboxylate transporter receptor subunit TctC